MGLQPLTEPGWVPSQLGTGPFVPRRRDGVDSDSSVPVPGAISQPGHGFQNKELRCLSSEGERPGLPLHCTRSRGHGAVLQIVLEDAMSVQLPPRRAVPIPGQAFLCSVGSKRKDRYLRVGRAEPTSLFPPLFESRGARNGKEKHVSFKLTFQCPHTKGHVQIIKGPLLQMGHGNNSGGDCAAWEGPIQRRPALVPKPHPSKLGGPAGLQGHNVSE